jgi:very-short-patch-repair endonuclease
VDILGVRAKVRVLGDRTERIERIARLQRGCVARRQLLQAGLDYDAIARRVRRRALHERHRGVYAVHRQDVPLIDETAALLAVRPGSALSHRSAGALWGVTAAARAVQVVMSVNSSPRLTGVRTHYTGSLPPGDLRVRDGLPVTSPARTLLELAAELSARELERAFTEAITLRITTPREIAETLRRLPARAGRGVLGALLDAEQPSAQLRSDTEHRLYRLIVQARLPRPSANAPLHGFTADFHWPEHRLVVEVDSYTFHTTRWAYERDRRKDLTLRAHGITVLRFGRRQVLDDALAVIAQIAGALGARR